MLIRILSMLVFLGAPLELEAAVSEPACVAVSRSNDGKRLNEQPLQKTFSSAQFVKWELDLGLTSYSVLFDKENEDYLLMITRGPAYQDGAALRGVFGKRGELRASLVTPEDTFQILCRLSTTGN